MDIERPVLLIVLFLAAGLIFLFLKKKRYVGFPSLTNLPARFSANILDCAVKWVLPIAVILGLILLASGLRFSAKETTRYGYGSDIVVVLDESGSMNDAFSGGEKSKFNNYYDDFPGALAAGSDKKSIGKIDAAKKLIRPFIAARKDRLGLVIFGDVVAPIFPLSFNQESFFRCFDAQTAIFGGTLIDLGLAQAIEILRESPAKTKIIILVSDGQGRLEDEKYQLSRQIKELGIRVYWIAVDHDVLPGWSPFSDGIASSTEVFMQKLNPATAKMFAINNQLGLKKAFEEISAMERSLISYKEKTPQGKIIFLCWILLGFTVIFYSLETISND